MTDILPGPKKPTVIYAIYSPIRKQYSRGGSGYPSWGKYPKTWGLGPFKNHLNMYTVTPRHFGSTYAPTTQRGDMFRKDCLIETDHPYHNCEVLEINPDGLTITARYDAIPWIWTNAVKPYYENQTKGIYKKYKEAILKFCEENGIAYD